MQLQCLGLHFGVKSDAELANFFIAGNQWAKDNVYVDWSQVPHIKGGYSAPQAHYADENTQLALAAPCGDGKLFFAGEATWVEAGTTVQAALDSGARAAGELAKSLEK